MIRKALLLMGVACAGVTAAQAQKCVTDEINKKYVQEHPGIPLVDQQLEKEIAESIRQMKVSTAMRGTADNDTEYLTIPVVVHIIHDYGAEYVADDKVYQLINELNAVYNKLNTAELSQVIPTFVPYIGNMRLRFRLATKDPSGNPTHGITRNRSYLTVGGDDQAKLDLWNPSNYLNIWFERVIGLGTGGAGIVAAYSMYPSAAAFAPYYDGLIANYQFINAGGSGNNTVSHEIGHYLNLSHPWGNNNNVGVSCGDDNVDDTPPTKGHFGGCDVYDVTCATNYVRNGINYPDTTNVQNIMDYADCELMFTQGQKERARAALRSSTAGRSNLWSASNLASTGALNARPSLPPVADFSVTRVFGCAGSNTFAFVNRSWNDTVTAVDWTFSNGATNASSSNTSSVTNGFRTPGWVTATLTATGTGGTNTVTKQAVYVADANATPAQGYYGEFAPGTDAEKYPAFDYFNTGRKWEIVSNAGVYDSYSMKYTNKDTRSTRQELATNTPDGDYADFFTPAFDVSGSQFSAMANLSFFTAGAYRSSGGQNDVLEITYSTDCGTNWRKLDSLKGAAIGNNSTQTGDFTPQGASQWTLRSIALPTFAKSSRVFFRFRYKPGVNANTQAGTGNNFYIDRIAISSNTTGINEAELNADGIALAPNPTSGSTSLVLSGKNTGNAEVQVTDITGKLVYQTSQPLNGSATRIEIPASSLTVKGMYLVQVQTGNQVYARKLVVY